MKKQIALVIAAVLIGLTLSTNVRAATPESSTPNQMPKHLELDKTQHFALDYLLYLPRGYQDSKQRWPLMLFLHGAGERGTDVQKVVTHGPPKNVTEHPDFPFILVSPQCPDHQTWSKDVLMGLLDEITRTYAVDTNRVYLTGLSMGGYGTWDLALSYPERFAAIAPICGGGNLISVLLSSRDKAVALQSLGIWAFHGAKDPVVPVSESQRMVEAV